MKNGKLNPKIPLQGWWDKLLKLLEKDKHEIKILPDILKWSEMLDYFNWSNISIAPDSYWQHFCWYYGKKCVVIFSQSNPEVFGHKENTNLLKDKKYLRENQFNFWEETMYNEDAFVLPEEVIKNI